MVRFWSNSLAAVGTTFVQSEWRRETCSGMWLLMTTDHRPVLHVTSCLSWSPARPSSIFLTRPAAIALVLLGIQLVLGLAAYVTRQASPNDPQPLNPMVTITVAHVACGALVFATTIILTLRSFKCLCSTGALEFVGGVLR